MKLIKNALIYKISLPGADALRTHLSEIPFKEINIGDAVSYGFVPVQEGDLVSTFSGGLAFSVRCDNKILPASAINAEVQKRAIAIETAEGRRVGRKERSAIKEMVIPFLLERAFVASKVITSFYDTKSRILIVPVSSASVASMVTSLLIRAVGAAKTETINISDLKGGLTTRLLNHIHDADADGSFGDFDLSPSVWLQGDDSKVTYQVGAISSSKDGILEAIAAGMKVGAVRLGYGMASFKLTSDFQFKQVKFEDSGEEQQHETAMDAWMHEAGVQTLAMVHAVEALCELFDYKAPESEEVQS